MSDNARCPVIVVVPARNEEACIAEVVRGILAVPGVEVMVVDDASDDETAARARGAGAGVLSLTLRLGAWGALQTGMRYAQENGYGVVVSMDGDGQHDPADIPMLLAPVQAGEADVVIGACVERGSLLRRFAWWLFRRVSGLRIRDLTSGFRAYGPRCVELLASSAATLLDYQDMGVLLLLQNAGLTIVERRVQMCPRASGHSRVFHTWRAVASYMALSLVLSATRTTYGSRVRGLVRSRGGRGQS
ncbi:hypothetical protein GGQ74_002339 [Desulfobaculum xiamenense]|uniref:Glycosyltransferase 2-like domain-containing protein n=1 Tax=Desulfobaculum xiamenense TaxID=995050 RepID=A0A846QIH8_9BACT|nr:hypothetical protein [Desulfobaculum xiamenense]